MTMHIPDYIDLYNQHEAERQRIEDKLPECENCGEKIMTDECYEINGELICP